MDAIKKFEVGKVYATCHICNSDCILSVKVLRRTAATVTIEILRGVINGERIKTCRINPKMAERFGEEAVKPWGSYSMSPTISATDAVYKLTFGRVSKADMTAERTA